MSELPTIFARHAADPSLIAAAARQSEALAGETQGASDSAAGETSHNTLEFRDDPHKAFIRTLQKLIEQDPTQALNLAQYALQDKNMPAYHLPALDRAREDAMAELARQNFLRSQMENRQLGMAFNGKALDVAVPAFAPAPAPVAARPRAPSPWDAPAPGWSA